MGTLGKKTLFEWLDTTLDELPSKGQIVLNLDANTVSWEVKATFPGDEQHERVEVRRFGRLKIEGRAPTK